MPSYILYYFNGCGRAEICRMLFSAAGISYTDKRIEYNDWEKYRSKMPCSMMPMLDIDGKMQFPQSLAIARYVAREYGFYGRNSMEMAKIDTICDSLYDLHNSYYKMYEDSEGRIMLNRLSELRQWYQDFDRRQNMSFNEMESYMMSSAMQGSGISSDAIFCGMGSSYNSADLMTTETMSFIRMRFYKTCERVLPYLEQCLGVYHDGNIFFMGEYLSLCDMLCYCTLEDPIREFPYMLVNYPMLMGHRCRVGTHSMFTDYFNSRSNTLF